MIKNAILSDAEANLTRKQNTIDTKTIVSSTRIQISKQPKVTFFLNIMGRNSLKTKKIYETGLVHFQDFLNDKYGGVHSLETIIEAIQQNQVDPYTLIDDFVSFETSNTRIVRGKQMKVLPQTIRTLLIGIKSFLAYYDIDLVPSKLKRKVKIPKVHRVLIPQILERFC